MNDDNDLSYSIFLEGRDSQPLSGFSDPGLYTDRITGILSRRNNVWVSDDTISECYDCKAKFGLFLRKHHCRCCGRIFCYQCSDYNIQSFRKTDAEGLISIDTYLSDLMVKKYGPIYSYRACGKCSRLFSKIRRLSQLIAVFELCPLTIKDFYRMRGVSKMWADASNIILSNFREIQYRLPNHKASPFEARILNNNIDYISAHNKYLCRYIKSFDWDSLSSGEVKDLLARFRRPKKIIDCPRLMCCRECRSYLTDTEVIDILMWVNHPKVRKFAVKCLTNEREKILAYLPILSYTLRYDGTKLPLAKHLIELSMKSYSILYSFYWELLVRLEDRAHSDIYTTILTRLVNRLSELEDNRLTGSLNLANLLIRTLNRINPFSAGFSDQQILNLFISADLFDKKMHLPLDPSRILTQIKFADIAVKKSSTHPILIPCRVRKTDDEIRAIPLPKIKLDEDVDDLSLSDLSASPLLSSTFLTFPLSFSPSLIGNGNMGALREYQIENDITEDYAFIFKSEDIRKDKIISSIIKIMDYILKENGMDLNIVTYNILPTSKGNGLIEIVPDSETVYNLKYKTDMSILNYIMQNNENDLSVNIRQRFINSTAAYCVITYLLGIGDRHLDNIMVTKDGRLFHIDYSFVLGHDPKPLAPQMRIVPEMVDALGGTKSRYYKQFEDICSNCYNCLRRHANLFMNMLYPLTQIETEKFNLYQLEKEIYKRFLPGEYRSQAKVHLIKTINDSTSSYNLMDFLHYQYKEHLNLDSILDKFKGSFY